ncbi:MAG: aminoacyl-tRNA hydrolase [Acidobacteria bacterium]|nr:aminoacyl-tRNA hydrolase [Acidobacteriota bacterium]
MKLIVGLGNPGSEYVLTPHNLGFLAVDYLAESWGTKVVRREGRALTGRAVFGGEEILLAKPQTFMNLSGLAVQQLLKKYSLEPEDLTVLTDDLDLPLGMIRVRRRGTAGGHNGLKSLIGEIQTDRFARVRMGVGPEREVEDSTEYLLGRFGNAERKEIAPMLDLATDAVELILREGSEKAMNRFNRRVRASRQEENGD